MLAFNTGERREAFWKLYRNECHFGLSAWIEFWWKKWRHPRKRKPHKHGHGSMELQVVFRKHWILAGIEHNVCVIEEWGAGGQTVLWASFSVRKSQILCLLIEWLRHKVTKSWNRVRTKQKSETSPQYFIHWTLQKSLTELLILLGKYDFFQWGWGSLIRCKKSTLIQLKISIMMVNNSLETEVLLNYKRERCCKRERVKLGMLTLCSGPWNG